jgi:hypothetical protein
MSAAGMVDDSSGDGLAFEMEGVTRGAGLGTDVSPAGFLSSA